MNLASLRAVRSLAVPLIVAALAAALPAAAPAAPLEDVDDPFYRYDKPLADIAPGTVLRRRTVAVGASGVTSPITATQVLYRTTKQSGAAITTVATILRPALAGTNQILSYQMAYNDLGSTCTPSYVLQGGQSSGATGALELGFMLAYLAQGFTVVTSDFEGPTHDYTAGQGAGYAVLDGIRAARAELGVPDPTPVGLLGYSGGATATQWATELAPEYAPETSIVGAAVGAPPVHYAHSIAYVDGSETWSSVLPWVLVGLFRGAEVDITRHLSPKGKELLEYVSDKCLDTGTFPGLRMSDMLVDNRDYRTIRPLVKVINSQIMGTLGTPRAPMFIGSGNNDGIGDGVMISADIEALAHRYCRNGVPVRYTRYAGQDHIVAIPGFEAEAVEFLQARFNGLPMISSCDTIGPGYGLEPLAVPPLPEVLLGKARRTRSGYRIAARVDREYAEKLSVSLYALRAGKRKRVATLRPDGALAPSAFRTLEVPLRRGVPGRSYEVVVAGSADQEKISATRAFRVPRRR